MNIVARVTDYPQHGTVVHFSSFLCRRKIGKATLFIYRTDTRLYAQLEDVKIVEEEQGKGYATRLLRRMLAYLEAYADREQQPIYLKFTSGPHREAANHLYEKVLAIPLVARATDAEGGTNLYQKIIRPKI
ncbi:MAG: GNAT family N-acetyltransferase [Candidatus Paceibacterota bacterium]